MTAPASCWDAGWVAHGKGLDDTAKVVQSNPRGCVRCGAGPSRHFPGATTEACNRYTAGPSGRSPGPGQPAQQPDQVGVKGPQGKGARGARRGAPCR